MTEEQWLGRTIAGRYRVEALLGKGGMGLVVRARHVHLDESVAIKLLLPQMTDVPGIVNRFLREARAASKIKSKHVVRVTDVDVLDTGVPYMVMEYLDGVSLAGFRRRRRALTIPESVRCVIEACEAISEAHGLGIVHRDLKPANLFLAKCRDGSTMLKVLDFGISKIDSVDDPDTTKAGQLMGSPKYMSPEQMVSAHDVDGRSDIWSLGTILYELITGRVPFVADTTPQLCALVLGGTPTPPSELCPEIPSGLEAIIMRCLERDLAKRYASVQELTTALAPFAIGATLPPIPERTSSPPGKDTDTVPPPRSAGASPLPRALTVSVMRNETQGSAIPRRRVLVGGALAAAIVLGVAGTLLFHRDGAPPIEPAAAAATEDRSGSATHTASDTASPQVTPTPSPEAAHDSPSEGAHAEASARPRLTPPEPHGRTAETHVPVVVRPLVKKPADDSTASADPFGGKRR